MFTIQRNGWDRIVPNYNLEATIKKTGEIWKVETVNWQDKMVWCSTQDKISFQWFMFDEVDFSEGSEGDD